MDLDFGVIGGALPYLWKGLQYTVELTAMAAVGGLFFGTLLALARLSPVRPLSLVAAGYVNLMRSVPLVLVIFWFFFLVTSILQGITGAEPPPQVGAERTALVTFVLFEAAFFCEIVRVGLSGQAGKYPGQLSGGQGQFKGSEHLNHVQVL
jgi:glutamate/aspartate transport system permease protein